MKSEKDATGILLSYDDGTHDGIRSIAGSGHAVLFQTPDGEWLLDKVKVFGSRYGSQIPPTDTFSIYVCDESFAVLHEFKRPFKIFTKGGHRWFTIPLDPIPVPDRFYICLSFNPTATKGVYVAYDTSVKRSHSKLALPDSHVSDVKQGFDWMIQAHLRPLRRK
jgi:RNA polymerase sigma-70 factor (ECF subfamily)